MFYKVYVYRHKGSKDNIDLYKLRLLSMYLYYIYIYVYIYYSRTSLLKTNSIFFSHYFFFKPLYFQQYKYLIKKKKKQQLKLLIYVLKILHVYKTGFSLFLYLFFSYIYINTDVYITIIYYFIHNPPYIYT